MNDSHQTDSKAHLNNVESQVSLNEEFTGETARETLLRLYEEGFHVCHLFYGKGRKGECVFCYACVNHNEGGHAD